MPIILVLDAVSLADCKVSAHPALAMKLTAETASAVSKKPSPEDKCPPKLFKKDGYDARWALSLKSPSFIKFFGV